MGICEHLARINVKSFWVNDKYIFRSGSGEFLLDISRYVYHITVRQ